jgi:hypothetical protein
MSVPAALLKEFILSLSGKARDHRGRLPAGTAETSWLGSRSALETRPVRRAAAVNEDCPAVLLALGSSGALHARTGKRGSDKCCFETITPPSEVALFKHQFHTDIIMRPIARVLES